MRKYLTVTEAQRNLPKYVRNGETYLLTVRGKPKTFLVPRGIYEDLVKKYLDLWYEEHKRIKKALKREREKSRN
jgi:antitoxin (DNA-binding transcriptional repressor) of toxin-antitoxin stability system